MDVEDSPQRLLEESAWLERLALSLVGDPHEARDLAQATWLAVLRSEGPRGGSRRAWMVGILRRLWAGTQRSQRNRQARESGAARSERVPSVQELTERTELQQRLLGYVRELPEHYRGPLLLRYIDGLSPGVIAEQLGLGVRTVHTRLHRGLELLRERMDRGHEGGRSGWMAGLLLASRPAALPAPDPQLPAAEPRSQTLPRATGRWVWLATAAAAAAVVGAGLRRTSPRVAPLQAPRSPVSQGARPAVAPPRPSPQRLAHDPVADRVPSQPEASWIAGTVIDWDGAPVPRATITVAPDLGFSFVMGNEDALQLVESETRQAERADSAGAFRVACPERSWIRAKAPGFAVAIAAQGSPADPGVERHVVLAPARSLSCRLAALDGGPVKEASVHVRLLQSVDQRFPFSFEHSQPLSWELLPGPEGEWSAASLPWVPEAELVVRAPGYEERTLPLQALGTSPLQLTPSPNPLRGRVTNAAGQPLADAWVGCSSGQTSTDAQGAFQLARHGSYAIVQAAAPGFAPASRKVGSSEQGELDFVLDTPSRLLRGRVLDPSGLPLVGIEVSLANPTVHAGPAQVLVLESVAAGRTAFHHSVFTDASGAFALPGAGPEARRLRLFDARTAQTQLTRRAHWKNGEDSHVFTPELLERVAGRVLNAGGEPVAGAQVSVQAYRYAVSVPHQSTPHGLFGSGRATQTDSAGRFTLEQVPASDAWLRVQQGGRSIERVSIDTEQESLRITLARRVPVSVELLGPALDRVLRFVDREDQPVAFQRPRALSSRTLDEFYFFDSQTSPTFLVPQSAKGLWLGQPGEPAQFVPIDLEPGRPLRLRL